MTSPSWRPRLVALDIDGTYFGEEERGPMWMQSVGISLGVTREFGRQK